MNNHDAEEKLLDELYLQSADESPPLELDQAILNKARTKAPESNIVSLFHWQRVLSVAAVMVLSIYIFFDVGEQSMNHEGVESFDSQYRSIGPSESALEERKLLGNEAEQVNKQKLKSREMSKPPPVLSETPMYFADDISTPKSESEVKSLSSGSMEYTEPLESRSPQGLSQKLEGKTEVARTAAKKDFLLSSGEENATAEPEAMLAEIEQLITAGNLVDAKKRYQELIAMYPDYSVPKEITDVLD